MKVQFPSLKSDGLIEAQRMTSSPKPLRWFPSLKSDGLIEAATHLDELAWTARFRR